MIPPKLPRVASGDELRDYHVNRTSDAVERLAIQWGAGFAYANGGTAGTRVDTVPFEIILWAKITGHDAPGTNGSAGGSSGPYAWTEQIPQVDGTWVDGYQAGTTAQGAAYEGNFNAKVPNGSIVRLRLEEATQQWSFMFAACGS